MHTVCISLACLEDSCVHVISLCMSAGLTSVLLPKASSAHWLYPLCLSQASSVLLHAMGAFSPKFRGALC